MKTKPRYIKSIISLALAAILGLQAVWLYHMYMAYHELASIRVQQCLHQSIDLDLAARLTELGAPIYYQFDPAKTDTSQTATGKVVTKDSTIVFTYDKNSFNDSQKVFQLQLKSFSPINIHQLDRFFNQLLVENGIQAKQTVIEIYDKDRDTTFFNHERSRAVRFQSYETDLIFVDIQHTIGIRAYVQTPGFALFRQMLFQLLLSIVLITATAICLFRLTHTIFRQKKEELVKRNFIDTMTHELKRPIATSIFILDVMLHYPTKKHSETKESLTSALFELRKLSLYVEKIQEISRGEEGKIELKREPVALLPFVQALKAKYQASDEKEITIQLDIEKDLSLTTDKLHFFNIMENLTENSIKYSGEKISIQISAGLKNGHIQIVHWDNGWGISKTEINHIFEKFYRGRSVEKRRKSGFGLGLSYIQLMMKNLDGAITVTSKENEFTECTLLF
jgi:K+-sensing histidine kinase KdpD